MPQAAGLSSEVDASVATGGTKDAMLGFATRGSLCDLALQLFYTEARAGDGRRQSHASMALAEPPPKITYRLVPYSTLVS